VKKILSIAILSVSIMGMSSIPSYASSILFKDVPPNFWGYQNVQWAIDNKIVDGYSDGTFKPNQNVLQSEFLAMLIRAYQPSDFVQTSDDGKWSTPYLLYAFKMGWKVVTPAPVDDYGVVSLTRGMVAQYIANANGKNYNMDDSIQYLLDLGISEGKTEKSIEGFKKDDEITRAEALTFIKRLKQKLDTLQTSSSSEEKYNSVILSDYEKLYPEITIENLSVKYQNGQTKITGMFHNSNSPYTDNRPSILAAMLTFSNSDFKVLGEAVTVHVDNVDDKRFAPFETTVQGDLSNYVHVQMKLTFFNHLVQHSD
jgi:hypothetical protein